MNVSRLLCIKIYKKAIFSLNQILIGQNLQKIAMDQTKVIFVVSTSNSALGQPCQKILSQGPYVVTTHNKNPLLPYKTRGAAPLVTETNACDRGFREVFSNQCFENDIVDIFMACCRKGAFSS